MSFLYALIKYRPLLYEAPDNFLFFSFPPLRSSRRNPRLEFGKVVSKELCAATTEGYEEAARNIFYFRGLRTKYVLRMHAWRHGGGTTDWKIVVASWRILARGISSARRNFESSWGPLEIGGGISSLRTTISLTYLFYLPVPVALLAEVPSLSAVSASENYTRKGGA